METNDLADGYAFWTFTDIFEENYFPSVPFHGGSGLLNLHGIPKPTYRAYELLHHLGSEMLLVVARRIARLRSCLPIMHCRATRSRPSASVLL